MAIPGEGGGLWPPLGNAVWLLNSEAPDGATICDVHLLSKSQKTGQPWLWSQVVGGGASGQQLVHLWPRGWDPTGGPGSGQQWMGTRFFHKQREISRDKAHTLRRQFPIIVSKRVNEPRVMK